MKGKTSVYRHYDVDGRLLYVGKSSDFVGRHINHLGTSGWVQDVVRITIDLYDDPGEAAVAERVAYSERPIHNATAARMTEAEIEQLRSGAATGRPPTYPVPSADQVAAFLADWNSTMKRALVDGRMRQRLGFDPGDKKALPTHWMRDLALKHQGTAKRNKE